MLIVCRFSSFFQSSNSFMNVNREWIILWTLSWKISYLGHSKIYWLLQYDMWTMNYADNFGNSFWHNFGMNDYWRQLCNVFVNISALFISKSLVGCLDNLDHYCLKKWSMVALGWAPLHTRMILAGGDKIWIIWALLLSKSLIESLI